LVGNAATTRSRKSFEYGFPPTSSIIPRSSAPELSNNIIQKGLAFIGDWSGTVVKSGRHERLGILPRRLLAEVTVSCNPCASCRPPPARPCRCLRPPFASRFKHLLNNERLALCTCGAIPCQHRIDLVANFEPTLHKEVFIREVKALRQQGVVGGSLLLFPG
jgi:hypothetical protein